MDLTFSHMQNWYIIIDFQTLLYLNTHMFWCWFWDLLWILCIYEYVHIIMFELFPFEHRQTKHYISRTDTVAREISASCFFHLRLGCTSRWSWPCIVDFIVLSSFPILNATILDYNKLWTLNWKPLEGALLCLWEDFYSSLSVFL